MKPYHIGIIEDDDRVREELKAFFSKKNAFQCTFAVNSIEKFLKYYHADLDLNILLLDINLPGQSGLDALPIIRREVPLETHIIMFTVFDEPDSIFKALCNGANGYLLKDLSLSELADKFKEVIEEGGSALSPPVARRIVEYFNPAQNKAVKAGSDFDLLPLERQVLLFLVEGKSYQSIAEMLNMSISGVKYHQRRVFLKLNITSRKEIAKMYMEGKIKL